MGLKSGNKGKYYRERSKRNRRRAAMRALRATLKSEAADPSATPAKA
ncbi:MAG TPA: hypothetical protein VMW17_14225 [Candidatus Binatia bacterium]|nr:hypothetical protein [Candidatus Binatia bacterium]